jgi:hypothetical protein
MFICLSSGVSLPNSSSPSFLNRLMNSLSDVLTLFPGTAAGNVEQLFAMVAARVYCQQRLHHSTKVLAGKTNPAGLNV